MSNRSAVPAAPTVDVNVPRFNQGVVGLVTGVGFLTQSPPLVVLMAIVLALSAFGPASVAPLTRLYVGVIRPRIQPAGPSEFEPAAPPRFAQRIGAGFLAAASLAFAVGVPGLGWGLTLMVTALASLAAATRICVGCVVYERMVTP